MPPEGDPVNLNSSQDVVAQHLQFVKLDSDHIVPNLEELLLLHQIPYGGIPIETADAFQPEPPCSPVLRDLLRSGLFDRNFQITTRKDYERRGKAVANIASAILIGKIADRIHNTSTQEHNPHGLQHIRKRIHDEIFIPDNPGDYVTEGYLGNVEIVLLSFVRDLIVTNIRDVLNEIATYDNAHPYKILFDNIEKVAKYKGLPSTQTFIERGAVSDTNHMNALFHFIGKSDAQEVKKAQQLKAGVSAITHTNHAFTREEALIIFKNTKAVVHKGLARNDIAVLQKLAPEDGYPKIVNGILTLGQYAQGNREKLPPFYYRQEAFSLVPEVERLEKLGTVVLLHVNEVVEEAERQVLADQQDHPETGRAEPLTITQCPARPRRFTPEGTKKPNVIKQFSDDIAWQAIQWLNEAYDRKMKKAAS